jgi:CheY-like chemotaxis protein
MQFLQLKQPDAPIGWVPHQSILVVEDDPMLRELLHEIFAEDGYDVLLASDGCTALQLAIEHQPSAIVLDGGLPNRSGWSVLSQLRALERTRYIPVVAVTGLPEKIPETVTLQLDGVLGKPFDLSVLQEHIRRLQEPRPPN